MSRPVELDYIEGLLRSVQEYITPWQGYLVGKILEDVAGFPTRGFQEALHRAEDHLLALICSVEGTEKTQ